jgi:hypothetical protein
MALTNPIFVEQVMRFLVTAQSVKQQQIETAHGHFRLVTESSDGRCEFPAENATRPSTLSQHIPIPWPVNTRVMGSDASSI